MQFAPAVYEHAAKLIDVTPWQASRDRKLLVEAHAAAYRCYHHRPVVVGIDIYNLEAEAYGAGIAEPEGCGIPAIRAPLCAATAAVASLAPLQPATGGRIAMIIAAAAELQRLFPEADVRVPVSGPFSLASNLVGFDNLLCDCLTDPREVRAALRFLAAGQIAFVRAVRAAGLGISVFESAATPPLLAPAQFRDLVLPALDDFLARAAELTGEPAACIIGGNTEPILADLMTTRPGYVICPSETDQEAFMARMTHWPEVTVRVNMDPGIIARGDPEAVFEEVDRVWALAAEHPRACLGTGVLPYETEPETVQLIAAYLRQKA